MNFDLCVGNGELFLEFKQVEDRDAVWENMINSYGWQDSWATKFGDGTGPRCSITIHQDKIPILYRWKCAFNVDPADAVV